MTDATGIRVEVPEPGATGEWSEPFKLPRSGKTVRLREPTVDDLLKAQRVAGKDAPDAAGNVATIAAMTEIEGKPARYEDLRALKLRDFNAISNRARKLGFLEEPGSTDAP